MKTRYPLFCLLIFVGCLQLTAQDSNEYYDFMYLQDAYTPLEGATEINLDGDEEDVQVSLGFDFTFFDKTLTSVIVPSESTLLLFPESVEAQLVSLIHAFENDIEINEEGSKLSYITSGEEDNHIFKLEWSHFGLYDSEDSDINFQVWLYENGNRIEFRYGNMQIASDWGYDNDKGPLVIIGSGYNLQDDTIEKAAVLSGNPQNPTISTITDFDTEPITLDGTPTNGTVYRFDNILYSTQNLFTGEISIFPNPVKDFLNISTKNIADIQINRISVLDMNGKTVITASNNDSPISIAELPTGKYMVRIETNQGICIKKIMH